MDFSLGGSMGGSLGLSGGNMIFGDRTLANLTNEMTENRARILAQGGPGLLLPNTAMLMKQSRPGSDIEMDVESREEAIATLKLSRPYYQDPHLNRPSGLQMAMTREGLSFFDAATGGRCPFTAAQWAELEHQALIYKYILHGYPVPEDLLLPIRKSVAALTGSPFGSSPGAWGSFNVGAGSSVDSEPGRCRRTDGKKWRCARPVVPEQKYCERHMHRGRHRSRKAATEAQANSPSISTSSQLAHVPPVPTTQHSAQGSNPINIKHSMGMNSPSQQQQHAMATSLPNKAFFNALSPATALAMNGSNSTASVANSHFQLPPQCPSASMQAANKERFGNGMSFLRPEHALASEGYNSSHRLLMEKQQQPLPWSTPHQLSKLPPLMHSKSTTNSSYLYDAPHMIMQEPASLNPFFDQQQQQQQLGYFQSSHSPLEAAAAAEVKPENQPLRHFFDDWPRCRESSTLSWSDAEDDQKQQKPKSSATQLSISITAASDLTSSPARSKNIFNSPLRLSMSRAFTEDAAAADPTHMGLGMALNTSHQSLWFHIGSMENAMGGPLAEALQSSGPHGAVIKRSGGSGGVMSSLNLLGDGGRTTERNAASPQESSRLPSPTGVLQKTFGCCFSDSSSSASSPASAKPEVAACDQNLKPHLTNGSPHVAT